MLKERIYPTYEVFAGQHLIDGDFRRMFLLPWTRLKEKRVPKPVKAAQKKMRRKSNVKVCDMCGVKKPLPLFPTVGQQKGKVCIECQRMDAGTPHGSSSTLPPTVATSPVMMLLT